MTARMDTRRQHVRVCAVKLCLSERLPFFVWDYIVKAVGRRFCSTSHDSATHPFEQTFLKCTVFPETWR